ncbi:MAG: hypothetical protein ACRDPY_13200 [Streptosporangiaceae bacterium]
MSLIPYLIVVPSRKPEQPHDLLLSTLNASVTEDREGGLRVSRKEPFPGNAYGAGKTNIRK